MRISDWSSDVCSSDLVGGGKSALDTVHRVGHLAEEDDIGPQRGGTARRARPSLAHRPVPVLPRPARGAQCRQQFAVHVEPPPCARAFVQVVDLLGDGQQAIGRASCRDRGWKYVKSTAVRVNIKKKEKNN